MCFLFKRSHLQEVYFFLSQVTPASARQVFLGETCEVDAVELGHMVAEALEDAAHYAVTSRVDFDTGLIAVSLGGIADCVGMDGAVFKLDTVGDALHVVLRDVFVGPYMVDFLLDIFGMGQLGGKVAVVGEQEDAGGVAVETPYGIYPLLTGVLHDVEHCQTSVGVIAGGDAVLGFVEKDVALAFQCDHLVIILDGVVMGNLGAEFGNDLPVDLYEALLDKFVGFAARADTGVGHELVETNLFVGIGYGHFILDALGTRGETLAAVGHAKLVLARLRGFAVVVVTTLAVIVVISVLTVVVSALTVVIVVVSALVVISALTVVIVVVSALVVVAALAVVVSVLTVVIPALAVIVVSVLAVVVISALTVVVISALTVVVIPALTVVVVTSLLLTGLVCAGVVGGSVAGCFGCSRFRSFFGFGSGHSGLRIVSGSMLLTVLITTAVVIVTVVAALPLLVTTLVVVTVVAALLTVVVVGTVLLIGTVSVISVSLLLLLLFVSLTGNKVVVTRNFVAHFGIRVCAAYRTAFPDTRSFSFFFVAVHKILLD